MPMLTPVRLMPALETTGERHWKSFLRRKTKCGRWAQNPRHSTLRLEAPDPHVDEVAVVMPSLEEQAAL